MSTVYSGLKKSVIACCPRCNKEKLEEIKPSFYQCIECGYEVTEEDYEHICTIAAEHEANAQWSLSNALDKQQATT